MNSNEFRVTRIKLPYSRYLWLRSRLHICSIRVHFVMVMLKRYCTRPATLATNQRPPLAHVRLMPLVSFHRLSRSHPLRSTIAIAPATAVWLSHCIAPLFYPVPFQPQTEEGVFRVWLRVVFTCCECRHLSRRARDSPVNKS